MTLPRSQPPTLTLGKAFIFGIGAGVGFALMSMLASVVVIRFMGWAMSGMAEALKGAG